VVEKYLPTSMRDGFPIAGHRSVIDASSLADQWKPLNLEEKKRYDREFLLGFQFIFASMQKPEGLPHITDVVLDKVGVWRKVGLIWKCLR
jgi:hypothetical protein